VANYLLLARGESLGTARVLAVSANPDIVDRFLHELAGESSASAPSSDARKHEHAPRRPKRESLRLVERDE
jgi:hypothetical protein